MIEALKILAVISASLFAGAALYINLVEHPVRMRLETRIAMSQWAPSYKRATRMQAPLALLSFLSGCVVWLTGASVGWLVASLLIGAVIPFTFIAIMPTNNKLLAPERDLGSAKTRALLESWGRLHAVRTGLSLVATIVFLSLVTNGA
jgi:hypothetical protein